MSLLLLKLFALQIQAALEGLNSINRVTVSNPQVLAHDFLQSFCPGRRFQVQFEDSHGDLPLLEIDSSNLFGSGLRTTVEEVCYAESHTMLISFINSLTVIVLDKLKLLLEICGGPILLKSHPITHTNHLCVQVVAGGLFLRPIPGHMLQTAEVTPQVCFSYCLCHNNESSK